MEFTRASMDSSMVFLAILGLIAAALMARAVSTPHRIARPAANETAQLFGTAAAAAALAALVTPDAVNLLPVLAIFIGAAALMRFYVHRLTMPGILWLTIQPLAMIVSMIWGALFLVEAELTPWIERLGLVGIALSLVMFALGFVERFAREAVMTHEQWRYPINAPAPVAPEAEAAVSVHLPCYAEPPDVVMATMDRLAALDYRRFEVLVCDNNTRDEALWRPLEAHCATLNARLGRAAFRFFHIAPLPGAKAGALNFCLGAMARETEVVAVIDADYLARPDFLARLTPFFADPAIGYVQTPHDYHGYDGSAYLTGCYWEYMPNNKVDLPGVSEYGGAFTIGTMCLLRAEALVRVGGWAEWCLTEDSEVSVRLRAAGYEGVYLGETFGRGLIPETFDDYKKQRFRWTAGPVQQLRRHWRLFLPRPLGPVMPGWTKLLEVLRCVAPVQALLGMAGGAFGLLAMVAAIATDTIAPIDVPNASWLVLTLGGLTWIIRTAHRYRLAGCTDPGAVMRGEVARMSLSYVVLVAGLAGLSRKPLVWRRTPKFAVTAGPASAVAAALPETMLAVGALIVGAAALFAGGTLGDEFAVLTFLGAAGFALRFLCAPYMAALGLRHARRQAAVPSGGVAAPGEAG